MKVLFRTTSEHGLTPGGVPDAANILNWLNERIIMANAHIEQSAMNGAENLRADGERDAYLALKAELFGKVYNT